MKKKNVTISTGLKLAVWEKAGTDGTILFLHGNSSSSQIFRSSFEDSNINHKMVAIDLPGHGDTGPCEQHQYEYRGLVKTIIEFLTFHLEGDYILVGNSLGGHLAVEALYHNLPLCKGLVIFGTPPLKKPLNPNEAFLPTEALDTFIKGPYTKKELEVTIQLAARGPEAQKLVRKDFERTDPAFRDVCIGSMLGGGQTLDEATIIKGLEIPVHVLHGKQDPSVNFDYIKSLNGIDKIYEIDNCGHYPSVEQPEIFNRHLRQIAAEVYG